MRRFWIAARVLHMEDRIGQVKEGLLADLMPSTATRPATSARCARSGW
jgi:imidazolonepropionase-like amidohydrolase